MDGTTRTVGRQRLCSAASALACTVALVLAGPTAALADPYVAGPSLDAPAVGDLLARPVTLPHVTDEAADAVGVSSATVERGGAVVAGEALVFLPVPLDPGGAAEQAPDPQDVLLATPPALGPVRPPSIGPIGVARCDGATVDPGVPVQPLLDAAGEDATICFAPGVHRLPAALRPQHGQQLLGLPGAVLNGSKVVNGFAKAGSGWAAGGQDQRFDAHGECWPLSYTGCTRGEDFFLDGRGLRQVDRLVELRPGTYFFDYATDTVHLGDDPTGRVVEGTVAWSAVEGRRPDWSPAHRVTVRGLVIEKFGGMAQRGAVHAYDGTDWVIEGNEVRLNHGPGIGGGTRSVVRGNHVHSNGQIGLVGAGKDMLVEGNIVERNNTLSFNVAWEAGGAKWSYTDGLVLRGNLFKDNYGVGMWTDIDNTATTYERNVVEGNTHAGIFHEISYDAVIRDNVVRGNGFEGQTWGYGAGIQVAHSSGVLVTGNVVEGNFNAISVIQQDRGSGAHGPYEVRDVRVEGNVITPGAGATGLYTDTDDDSVYTSRGVSFQGNTYVGAGSESFADRGRRMDFSSWQAVGRDGRGLVSP